MISSISYLSDIDDVKDTINDIITVVNKMVSLDPRLRPAPPDMEAYHEWARFFCFDPPEDQTN